MSSASSTRADAWRHGARIAVVAIGAAIYAPVLALAILRIFGVGDLRALYAWLTGAGCGGAPCQTLAYGTELLVLLVFVATLPVLVGMGILWVRRRHRDDRDLRTIRDDFDRWAHEPPAPPPEEPARFYRDRQGRLRPLTFHDGDQSPNDRP